MFWVLAAWLDVLFRWALAEALFAFFAAAFSLGFGFRLGPLVGPPVVFGLAEAFPFDFGWVRFVVVEAGVASNPGGGSTLSKPGGGPSSIVGLIFFARSDC